MGTGDGPSPAVVGEYATPLCNLERDVGGADAWHVGTWGGVA